LNIYSVFAYHTGDGMEYWDKIVVIHLAEPRPRSLSIKDSKDAAWLLLNRWPLRNGRSYRRAILNCSAALRGQGPNDVAQWSFVVAAMEAALPYEVVDRFDMEIAAVCRELIESEGLPDEPMAPAMDGDGPTRPYWWSPPHACDRPAR
jgi:hypothetical protein